MFCWVCRCSNSCWNWFFKLSIAVLVSFWACASCSTSGVSPSPIGKRAVEFFGNCSAFTRLLPASCRSGFGCWVFWLFRLFRLVLSNICWTPLFSFTFDAYDSLTVLLSVFLSVGPSLDCGVLIFDVWSFFYSFLGLYLSELNFLCFVLCSCWLVALDFSCTLSRIFVYLLLSISAFSSSSSFFDIFS